MAVGAALWLLPVAGWGAAASESRGARLTGWEWFQRGGKLMWPIAACSVIGLTFIFERALALRRRRHLPPGFRDALMETVDRRGVETGLTLCHERPSSLGRVLHAALLRYDASRQEMELAVQGEGTRLLFELRRHGRVLGTITSVAPLLGLLGTVLGMVGAFEKVRATKMLGDPSLLAGDISVALLTTLSGLAVALPCYVAYRYYRGKADDIVHEIEETAVDFVIELDRRARRSIRQIPDLELDLETKTAPAIFPPDLAVELAEGADLERDIRTSITTPAAAPAALANDELEGETDRARKKASASAAQTAVGTAITGGGPGEPVHIEEAFRQEQATIWRGTGKDAAENPDQEKTAIPTGKARNRRTSDTPSKSGGEE